MSDMEHERLAAARTLLFVPGDRPDRFARARDSGADAIVLDLEDSVSPAGKAQARAAVAGWLADGGSGVVRVNAATSSWFRDDLAALGGRCCAVMLPKVTLPRHIAGLLAELAPGSCVLPILETASAILDARALCAVPGVVRAVFGNGDLAAELGIDHADREALLLARASVVLASSAAGVAPPLDGVTTALDDEDLLVEDAQHARRMGFGGKVCVHPRQVPVVNAAFTPSADELARARAIMAQAGDGSATAVDGQMIDAALVRRAQRLLNRAHVTEHGSP